MAYGIFTRISSLWKEVKYIYVRVSGVWKNVYKIYVNVGGTWTQCFLRTISYEITANMTDVVVADLFANPTKSYQFVLTIASGITLTSSGTGTPVINTAGFPTGSTLKIINNGTIVSPGGDGGQGGKNNSGSCESFNGSPGGDCIDLSLDVEIDNTLGQIFAGGGGGGGGGAYIYPVLDGSGNWDWDAGGGGGGGSGPQSATNGLGGAAGDIDSYNTTEYNSGGLPSSYKPQAGTDGNDTTGGTYGAGEQNNGSPSGGYGGIGGDIGQDGTDGQTAPGFGLSAWVQCGGGIGGLSGNAVRLNSHSVTWLGGYTSTQVKGYVN